MEQFTTGSYNIQNCADFQIAKQPYLTREEWEFFTAALHAYIDANRRVDLAQKSRVEAAEMLAAAMGRPYKRPKGKE